MMVRAAFPSVLADITLSPLAASQLREEAAIDVRYGQLRKFSELR